MSEATAQTPGRPVTLVPRTRFEARLRRLFRAATGSTDDQGAIQWGAAETGKHYRTVLRWCTGPEEPDDPMVWRLVEAMEARLRIKVPPRERVNWKGDGGR